VVCKKTLPRIAIGSLLASAIYSKTLPRITIGSLLASAIYSKTLPRITIGSLLASAIYSIMHKQSLSALWHVKKENEAEK
jgi:hypothetical protein